MELVKRCTKCGVEKPLDCFSKDRQKKDGLQFRCRDCQAAQKVAHRARVKSQDKADKPKASTTRLKKCGTCETKKPLDEFREDQSLWDGLSSSCRECESAIQRAKREPRSAPKPEPMKPKRPAPPHIPVEPLSVTTPPLNVSLDFNPRVEPLQDGYVVRDGRGQTFILESFTELAAMSRALMYASDDISNREYEADRAADELWAKGNR